MGVGEGCNTGSPILINLDNNSAMYNLTSVEAGVSFDLQAVGAQQRVAWTAEGSRVAFLVIDRNANSFIDDGSELFGTSTRKSDGSLAANGFEALGDLDSAAGVPDGRIDHRDPIYSRLQVWTDTNHNGRSEPSELQTLSAAGVQSLLTAYSEGKHIDRHGNAYKFKGTALLTNTGGQTLERRMVDVFLKIATP